MLCAIVANGLLNTKEHGPFKPEDFFLSLRPPEEPSKPMTGQQMEDALKGITRMMGGTIKGEQ
jgi:hypothetical protein